MPKQPKYLLSVDPGLMTGVAFLDITDEDDPLPLWDEELKVEEFYVRMGEVFKEFHEEMVVVWEDYHITARTATLSQQPWSLNLIGVMQYFCWKYDVKFTVHSPSRKPFATPERLRQVGFWHKGEAGHANDAFRHAMVFLVDRNPNWARKLIIPSK